MLPIWLAGNAFNYLSPVVYVGGEGHTDISCSRRRFNVAYYRSSASVFLDQIFNGLSVWPMVVFGFIIFLQSVSSDELSIFFYIVLSYYCWYFCCVALGIVASFSQASRDSAVSCCVLTYSMDALDRSLIRMENEMLSFRNVGMKLFWNSLLLSFCADKQQF